MQSLEVISINLWDVLISLANLAILFVLIKKFLYKPVKKVIAARQEAIAKEYAEAEADPTKEKQTPLDSGVGSGGPWGVLPRMGGRPQTRSVWTLGHWTSALNHWSEK